MGEEKGLTHLQRILRSLCFRTQWKYAVFWKLQHRDRMVLTWEEAYYDNNGPADPSDHMLSDSTFEILYDGHYLPVPLGLAVVKMSYPVYSLGEGIIGQVAVTGKHEWIFADKPSCCSLPPYDCCDGRQSQFSAGIRTTAIVAVVPLGVVQLGSPNMITEDMELVNHIKDVFCSIQDSSIEFSIPNGPENSMQSSLYLSKVSSQHTGLEIFNDFPPSSNKSISNTAHSLCHSSPSLGICNNLSYNALLHGLNKYKSSEVFNQHLRFESTKCGTDRTVKLHKPKSAIVCLEQQKQVQMNMLNKEKCVQENSSRSDTFIDSKHSDAPASYIFPRDKSYSGHSMQQFDEKLGIDYDSAAIGSVKFDSAVYLQSKELELPDQMKMLLGKDLVQKSDMEVSCIDTAIPSLTFPADCDLYEALGTAFKKAQRSSAWDESEKSETVIQNETPERLFNSHLTTKCGSEYLSEAVMGIVGSASSNGKSENSLCTLAESLVTTGKKSDTSNQVKHCSSLDGGAFIHSSGIMEDGAHHLKLIRDSKEVFVEKSSTESSFKALSNNNKQSELHLEPTKVVRKRSRPRQSRRPQPADRRLIQDRVKELRELVPNGSKCNINSLLERAVEHMLFLQSATKHTEKIKKFDPSKFSDKAKSLLGACSHDHGSSWVVDVGNETEACPIVIKNLNMNGQMLVEMCEEGSHFLDIAEVLRRLDLAIIKGVTETRGEKTWASFVVEGQNNRRIHRRDIMWALMQLLQPKTNIQ